jgi:hypothetical protein
MYSSTSSRHLRQLIQLPQDKFRQIQDDANELIKLLIAFSYNSQYDQLQKKIQEIFRFELTKKDDKMYQRLLIRTQELALFLEMSKQKLNKKFFQVGLLRKQQYKDKSGNTWTIRECEKTIEVHSQSHEESREEENQEEFDDYEGEFIYDDVN